MPLEEDPILGLAYIDPTYFVASAAVFGCKGRVELLQPDELLALLAAASREIDAAVGRDFATGQIAENHPFDLRTRRIKVNRPPLVTLVSYKIRTSPGLVSAFTVTPVTTDGVNNVSFGAIYYNRQENYLELASLAMGSSLTAAVVSLGMTQPQVEIVYTSHADVPKEITAATGYLAAHRINQGAANQLISPGLAAVKADDVEVRRDAGSSSSSSGTRDDDFPPVVKRLLRNVARIAIG